MMYIFRFSVSLFLFSIILKGQARALVDNAGQEVIEVRNPLKDLPADLDEEPSIEKDDVRLQGVTIATTQLPFHKKDKPKIEVASANRRMNLKPSKSDDDEARIEKELAELYKDDPGDYKGEIDGKANNSKLEVNELLKSTSGKVKPKIVVNLNSTTKSAFTEKRAIDISDSEPEGVPIARANKDFNFQPDINNKAEVERFRTSVDDIVCERKFTTERLVGAITPSSGANSPLPVWGSTMAFSFAVFMNIFKIYH